MIKIKFDKYMDIRCEFVNSELTIKELADKYSMNLSTVYSMSMKQGWSMLKENRLGDLVSERNAMVTSIKSEGVNFYWEVMERCNKLMKLEDSFAPKNLKLIQETYSLAFEKIMILSREKLINAETNNVDVIEGLLGKLNKGEDI